MPDVSSPSSPGRQSRVARQVLLWTLKILVSGGLMYVLFRRVNIADVWGVARTASIPWLVGALGLYFLMILVSAWRWGLLLGAQHIRVPFGTLLNSFLVATFFNNFLPSNIGGDVIRIRDTARAAGSKTLAATIVLMDRGIGLLGLVFVAAVGTTIAARMSEAIGPIGPGLLWLVLAAAIALAALPLLMPHGVGALLRPLRVLHQAWVEQQIGRLITALAKFREDPRSLAGAFVGAILVQAVLVAFYAAVAEALQIPVPLRHLAILVPLSFLVQMAPVSVNGLGVRETTFVYYFSLLHLPGDAAIALSLISAVLVMLCSTSGALVLIARRHPHAAAVGPS